jgi:glycine betaine/proline transport system permease protein
VLSSLRKAEFGESLVAGIVIALLAMILDRITYGLATREPEMLQQRGVIARHRFALTLMAAASVTYVASLLWPTLQSWPSMWTVDPAGPLNAAITWFVVAAKPVLDGFKNIIVFALVLPMKIGLLKTISPFTWGFALQPWHMVTYAGLVLGGAWYAFRSGHGGTAVLVLTLGVVFAFGLTNLTWPGLTLLVVYFGDRSGGIRLAVGSAAAMAFILLSGSYDKAVLSLQLCGLAVAVSFLLGSLLGVIAAENDRFSQFLRPLNDTLQTMPPFVLLIPIIMIFKIGEFSALLAIISYAIVAPIRYTEYGLRAVPKDVVEASVSMGCTPYQLLRYTKIPLAMPNIMLGLNQAIMFGISMLVVTALVGTTDLGQVIYVGLSKGNFGIGFLAGVVMAVIAILADQFCRAWQRRISDQMAGEMA